MTTTGGTQEYHGAVTLGAADTLKGSTVTFDSTVNGAQTLTITGNAVIGGAVGGTTALANLSVSGTTALNANVTTSATGGQTYTGAATLGADVTLTGQVVDFSSTVAGAHALTVAGFADFEQSVGTGTASPA